MVMLCLAAWSSLAARASLAQRPDADAGVMTLDEGWHYRWGDSPLDERGVPVWTYDTLATAWQPTATLFVPPGEAEAFLWLRIRLPEDLPDDPMVGTAYIMMSVEAYLDTTRIYRFGKLQPDSRNKYASQIPQFIPLPADAQGRMLSLRIFSDYRTLTGIQAPVYLGSEGDLLRAVYRGNMARLIIGILLLVIGGLALVLLVKVRERRRALLLFYLGLFSLCFGLAYIADSPLSGFVITSPVVSFYLATAFFLFPVGLLGFFEQVIGPGYKRVIRRLWQIHLVFYVVFMGVSTLSLPLLAEIMLRFFFGLLTVSLLTMVVTRLYPGPITCSKNPNSPTGKRKKAVAR